MDESDLLTLDRLAVETVDTIDRKRFAWDALASAEGRPFVGLVGPRGSGKTVLLRQLRREREDSLYISADTLEGNSDLFTLVRRLNEGYGIGRFFVDEIHAMNDYPRHLKQIYDFLPVRLWFTSSVSLSITAAGWDLSRRVKRHTLMPFSYREFLWFAGEPKSDRLSLEACLIKPIPSSYLRLRGRFERYLHGGLHPFMLEPGSAIDLFSNVVEKVITQDIPRFDRQLTVQDIDKLQKTLEFIGRSPVDGIVNGLQFHTIGGVVSPGTPILGIVPEGDDLIVEARVSPNDIDRVALNQEATIRFSAFGRAVPTTFGRVAHLSADSFVDEATGYPYYQARIEVTDEGMEDLQGLELVPGMPAEVFIATGSRTFLQYLFKPLTNALARSFIED